MIAGGATALAGRFFPGLAFHRDPVIAGTAVNLAILLAGFARMRVAGRCPGDEGVTPYSESAG
jgi:hypothetical protein